MGTRTSILVLASLFTAGLAVAAPGNGASGAVQDAIEATEPGKARGKAVSEAARAHKKARSTAEPEVRAEHAEGERAEKGKATAADRKATRQTRKAERAAKRAERRGKAPVELPTSDDTLVDE